MNKSIIVGIILVGGAISAAATLMNTSSSEKSGKDMGEQAKAKKDSFMGTVDFVRTEGTSLKDQIMQTSKEGSVLLKDLITEIKASIEGWKNTIEPHQKNIQRHLTQIEESLKELEEKNKK